MSSIDSKHHVEDDSSKELFSRLTSFPIRLFSSENLFGNGNEVLIQHRGEQYHLRLTRNDKLILTK